MQSSLSFLSKVQLTFSQNTAFSAVGDLTFGMGRIHMKQFNEIHFLDIASASDSVFKAMWAFHDQLCLKYVWAKQNLKK